MKSIKLPEGHKWKEVKFATSSETCFECETCGATFVHDMIDNSQNFEDGDGKCDEEPCSYCGSVLFNDKGECEKCGL